MALPLHAAAGIGIDVLRAKGFTNVENGGAFEDLIAAGVKTAN